MSNISNSEISADTSFNDTLNYFLNNMIKSYSFSPTELYYNAPKSKGTFAVSYDNLILPDLWGELSFNYVSKFDFVSGLYGHRDLVSNGILRIPDLFSYYRISDHRYDCQR